MHLLYRRTNRKEQKAIIQGVYIFHYLKLDQNILGNEIEGGEEKEKKE